MADTISAADQIALPLENAPRFGRDDYMVGASNEAALAWCDRWPDWPAPVIVLVGPPGAGKSHLLTIWQQQSGAENLPVEKLAPDLIAEIGGREQPPLLAIDQADRIVGDPVAEEGLFHLFNHVRAEGGSMLLTAVQQPARWGLALPDLESRLKASPVITLAAPDDAMMAALLVKQLADRQLIVGQEVVDYLLARVERSYAAIRDLVAALDQLSLAKHRRITVPLAREILNEQDQSLF